MNATEREILVLPRQLLSTEHRFLHADAAKEQLDLWESHMEWLPRTIAETRSDWIQPIPCVLIGSANEQFYIFRRTRETRDDLKGRLSFLIGGHVDGPAAAKLFAVLEETLRREVEEEIGVSDLPDLRLLGLVADYSTVTSSRHVGVVFRATLHGHLTTHAPEEFSTRSKLSGTALGLDELCAHKARLDPWSSILYEEYLTPHHNLEEHFQRAMPLVLSE